MKASRIRKWVRNMSFRGNRFIIINIIIVRGRGKYYLSASLEGLYTLRFLEGAFVANMPEKIRMCLQLRFF